MSTGARPRRAPSRGWLKNTGPSSHVTTRPRGAIGGVLRHLDLALVRVGWRVQLRKELAS